MSTTNLLTTQNTAGLTAGSIIGPYRILESIAQGGEALLWSAWDQQQGHVTILKEFLVAQSKIKNSLQLSLDHPHIAQTYEIAELNGTLYASMEYFPFGSLANYLDRGLLSVKQVLRLMSGIISALHYTHDQQIIHRDLKPSNILLDASGEAYITDFGIARSLSASTAALHTGQGTAAYSSPEQHTMEPLDVRADIYSLGVMLYEMLTGTLPWNGQVALAVMQMSSPTDIPDPALLNPDLPPGTHEMLKQFTAADPDLRPASVLDAWHAIKNTLGEPDRQLSDLTGHNMAHDVKLLLKRELTGWQANPATHHTRLTQFAAIHSAAAHSGSLAGDSTPYEFLLHNALINNFAVKHWWTYQAHPEQRLSVCERLIQHPDPAVSARVMQIILDEPGQLPQGLSPSPVLLNALLDQIQGPNASASIRIITDLLPENPDWQELAFGLVPDTEIGELAAESSDPGVALNAARLIGKLKSEHAFAILMDAPATQTVRNAQIKAWRTAGSLPGSVRAHGQVSMVWLLIHALFTLHFRNILGYWMRAGIGAGLAIGLHIFVGYRWLLILDSNRVLNALGGALLFGPVLGAGMMTAAYLSGELRPIPLPIRTALSGGAAFTLLVAGFAGYHLLFLNAAITGYMFYLLLFGFVLFITALNAIHQPTSWKAVLSTILFLGALLLSWEIYLTSGQTPLLYFESADPIRTGAFATAFAGLMCISPYLFTANVRGAS